MGLCGRSDGRVACGGFVFCERCLDRYCNGRGSVSVLSRMLGNMWLGGYGADVKLVGDMVSCCGGGDRVVCRFVC